MHQVHYLSCEYESVYESEYGDLYDQNIVFYDDDEEDEDGSCFEDCDDEGDYDSDFDDVVLEEIPFVYCPPRGETGEA